MISAFAEWAAAAGIPLSDAQVHAFDAFEDALYAANAFTNLTRVPREDCWRRHFVDSLLFHETFPPNSTVLDIGSGAGFPAWPLACARPDLKVTAIDSNGKATGFLQRQKLPNLTVIQARAEEWNPPTRFDFVTGRAVAPLAVQLEISVRACSVGGVIGPMRVAADEHLLVDADAMGITLLSVVEKRLPVDEARRAMPLFKKLKKTSGNLPRRWPEIVANPLVRSAAPTN